MNRAARREEEKQTKKVSNKQMMKWVKSLTKAQRDLLAQYVNIETNKNFDRMTYALDTAFTASLIEVVDEVNMNDIDKIFNNVFEYMKEDREKDGNLKKEFKSEGEFISFMKNLESIVKTEASELLNAGLNQKEVREKLITRYPTLSKSKIINAVKKTKEMLDLELEKKETTDNPLIEPVKKEVDKLLKAKGIEVENVVKEPLEKATKPLESIRVKSLEVVGKFTSYSCKNKRVKFEINRNFDKKTWAKFKNEVDKVFEKMEAN